MFDVLCDVWSLVWKMSPTGYQKRNRKRNRKKERKKEHTMCLAYVIISHRAPVVIRSTRIGSRVEINAPFACQSLRLVVHPRQTLFCFFAPPPSICTPAHTLSLLLCSPPIPIHPSNHPAHAISSIPRMPARLTPSKLRREPAAPHTYNKTTHWRGSRQFQFSSHHANPGPPVLELERTSDIRPASTARPPSLRCAASVAPDRPGGYGAPGSSRLLSA